MPSVRLVLERPSNETKRTCAAFARRVMPATASSALDKNGEVVSVAAAVEDVVAAEVVSVEAAPLVVVMTGFPQAAASAITSKSTMRPMSRAFLTSRAYSDSWTAGRRPPL